MLFQVEKLEENHRQEFVEVDLGWDLEFWLVHRA